MREFHLGQGWVLRYAVQWCECQCVCANPKHLPIFLDNSCQLYRFGSNLLSYVSAQGLVSIQKLTSLSILYSVLINDDQVNI